MISWRQRFEDLGGDALPILQLEWCQCRSTKLRRRVIGNGVTTFADQCLRCGRQVGNCTSRTKVDKPADLESWDAELVPDWEERQKTALADSQRRREVGEEATSHAFQLVYNEYLGSPEWKVIRNKIIARQLGVCEGCRNSRVEQVHHLTYKRVGWELLIDLVGLCRICHELAHDNSSRDFQHIREAL